MISSDKINDFKILFGDFKRLEIYNERQNQKLIAPLFREIIWETLKNEKISNEHLTGLIQMFGWRCKEDNFKKYMELCVKDKIRCEELIAQSLNTTQRGFTNIGKTAVNDLGNEELKIIKTFLLNSFEVKSIKQAEELCKDFENYDIPQVKQGIFSPWLYYINPSIFPIVNNSHANFKKWFGVSKIYTESIPEYHQFMEAVNEQDFAGIDYFAHLLTKEGTLNYRRYLELNGNNLYKISHGIFSRNFKHTGVWELLEANKWICLHEETKKHQGENFKNDLKIGDFVYLCYGGDEVSFIGKIKSGIIALPKEILQMFNAVGEPWIYREVEVLFEPKNQWLNAEMKQLRSAYMPSGHTTFVKVPEQDLEWINSVLFIPYYNVEVLGEELNEDEENSDIKKLNINSMNYSKNTILYGPPGTGKTFHSISYAVAIVENKDLNVILEEGEIDRKEVKKRFDDYVESGLITFTTFHQTMNYEDFIEGIKPLPPEKNQPLKYDIVDGIFKTICSKAESNWFSATKKTDSKLTFENIFGEFQDLWESDKKMKFTMKTLGKEFTITGFTNKSIGFKKANGGEGHTLSISTLKDIYYDQRKSWDSGVGIYYPGIIEKLKSIAPSLKQAELEPNNYVIVIDEINRGNVSQIFGELITLIEDDKRIGSDEALEALLPYSKDSFGVPPNLHIIGTMNTADRSVEALDTALRRRFSFVPKMPEENKLKVTGDGLDLPKLLNTINNRLRILKDNDHTIGHAWLWNVLNISDLKNVFDQKILPLLQEYFYNDYEKLGLLLGDAFFELPHKRVVGNEFASFSGSNGLSGQYRNKYIYKLKNAQDLEKADFLSLTQIAILDEDK